jgi:hypothetical protein
LHPAKPPHRRQNRQASRLLPQNNAKIQIKGVLSQNRTRPVLEIIIKHFVTFRTIFIDDTFADDTFADDTLLTLDFEGESQYVYE